MKHLRKVLPAAMVATVLLCAQAVWCAPISRSANGTVNLTVEPFVAIRIPDGEGDAVNPVAHAMTAYAAWQGTRTSATTDLDIYVTSNCPTWVRVPDIVVLKGQNPPPGEYEATATVKLIGPPSQTVSDNPDGFYYAQLSNPVSVEARMLTATVSVQKAPAEKWSCADLAGYYSGTMYVDIMASDASTYPASPGDWPTH